MSYLTETEEWLRLNQNELEQYGQVVFRYGPAEYSPRMAHMNVQFSGRTVELSIWETGQAEFNRGAFPNAVFEHVEVSSAEELRALLERFKSAVVNDSWLARSPEEGG